MKKLLFLLPLLLIVVSCDKKSKTEKAIEETPVEDIRVERFDKKFFETPVSKLPELKAEFPAFFPSGVPDKDWTDKMTNPLWRELYGEVQKTFGDFEPQRKEIEELFRHIKFYYPKTSTPKVITLIYEMDYNTKAIYADSLILISLEMYLGRTHKFYEFPEYQKQTFEKSQILPDIVSSFSQRKIPPPGNNTFLSQMVYAGKALYMKDLLLPSYPDHEKIGYTPEQLSFCTENENYIWSYFIEQKLLYSTDSKLAGRFINPAPFSKFYLEIDNDTPGRIATWTGWQIVRAYMKNNDVSLQQLLDTDADEIFKKSKYKPKK